MRYDRETARRGEKYIVDWRGKQGASGAPSPTVASLAKVQQARRSTGNGTGVSALAKTDPGQGLARRRRIKRAVKKGG